MMLIYRKEMRVIQNMLSTFWLVTGLDFTGNFLTQDMNCKTIRIIKFYKVDVERFSATMGLHTVRFQNSGPFRQNIMISSKNAWNLLILGHEI